MCLFFFCFTKYSKSLGSLAIEAAISLLSYNTGDDDLIFALCRDGRIRVVSLKQQTFLLIHNVFNQSMNLNSRDGSDNGSGKTAAILSTQKPISMKFWWYENETYMPNLVVYCTDTQYNQFYFYQMILPNQSHSPMKNHSIHSSSFNSSSSILNHAATLPIIDYYKQNNQLIHIG